MKKLILLLFVAFAIQIHAQVAINTDGTAPDNSAMLDVKSTTKGLLAPRMTQAQRVAIVNPATGLLVFQTNGTPGLYYNSGTPALPVWTMVGSGSSSGPWLLNGTTTYFNSGYVGIGTDTPVAKLHVTHNSPQYTAMFGTDIGGLYGWQYGSNVSIGDSTYNPILYIGQNENYKGYLIWGVNEDPALGQFWIGTYNGSNPVSIQPFGGNVGIGTQTPISSLQISYYSSQTNFGYSTLNPNRFTNVEDESGAPGQAVVYAFRNRITQNNGNGYGAYGCNTAINGFSEWGDNFSFGTSGFNWNDYMRCGGVIGAEQSGTYWGSLGYKSSSYINYGGYFSSSSSGGGKSSLVSTGIGIGSWGDLMGADIHGKVYGLYTEGANYAMYANGVVFKNNLDVHLQENGSNTNTVLYTTVSSDVTIQTSGYATLSGGTASIDFDAAFAAAVSSETPVVVTVTPTGNSNGVYLSSVSKNGFKVVENNGGKSSVTVSYIAIGKRAGYENPVLPQEVISSNYNSNMASGLHNDGDTKTNGNGLYYENGKLVVGVHPSMLPDPNRPVSEIVTSKRENSAGQGQTPGKGITSNGAGSHNNSR